MKWFNAYECRKFEEEQSRLAEQYRNAGMSEEDIRKMYEYDLADFNSNRRFAEHNQEIPRPPFEDNDEISKSPLYASFIEQMKLNC